MPPRLALPVLALLALAPPALAQDAAAPSFGDDSAEWAGDGECDDRRFTGPGMAAVLTWSNVGRDAADCRAAFEGGAVTLWDLAGSRAATQCASVAFGTDEGEYARDGECDDIRFEGLASASSVGPDLVQKDAADCSQLCAFGVIGLRDY